MKNVLDSDWLRAVQLNNNNNNKHKLSFNNTERLSS